MRWMESQLEERAKFDREMAERAYAELAASVSGPRSTPHFGLSDVEQVDGAARTCLKYIGIEPGRVPDDVTDAEERVELLCRPTGTMRRQVRLEPGWQKQAFGAMLARLDSGQMVALLPRGLRGYYYLDPDNGRKVRVTGEVASHIEEDATLFYRPLPARPCTVRDLVAFIFRVFDVSDYLVVLFAALAVTLIGLAPAWANGVAFGVVAPSGQSGLILPIAALLLGVAVSTALINAARNLIMSRVATKLDVVTAAATFSRILTLPNSFFKEYEAGDLGSRIFNISALAQMISAFILGSGLSALLSLVYIFQVGAYAPVLAFPALMIVLVQACLTILITWLSVDYEQETMRANAALSGLVTALLSGIQKIKLAGAEDRAFARWARGYAVYARAAYNRPIIFRALPAVVGAVGLLGNILLYYLAGSDQVALEDYMAFNVAFGQISGAIMALATTAGQISQINPMLELVSPILNAKPEISEDKPTVQSLSGGIDVSDVVFRYNEGGPAVLQKLSFRVKPGEYVALVGKSGCGKSTIMRLLLGFEKPELGTILYGPYDVTKVDLRSLRQHIGVVMQDGSLFMGDIANNITISTPEATLDDAWAAAEIAGIADDIRKMPMGMQTLVSEGGGGVSGGQRQRLMIARAVCGNRRILLLDEATSALDNRTQKHVADSLASLNCTRIVIAHRLSTVRHCDRILVVDEGRIVEEGSYEELIAKGGFFADLVERQRLETEA